MRKLLWLSLMVFSINIWAADSATQVGYTTLKTGSGLTEANGKVNVKEFFSFMCPFCQKMELTTEALAKDDSINLQRIQVAWGAQTDKLAKILAIYEKYGQERLYQSTFDVMVPLEGSAKAGITDGNNFRSFLIDNNVESSMVNNMVKDYDNGSETFDTGMNKQRTKTAMSTYQITGTPTFVVADKYVVNPALPEATKQLVLRLVAKVIEDSKEAKQPAISSKQSPNDKTDMQKSKAKSNVTAKKEISKKHNHAKHN